MQISRSQFPNQGLKPDQKSDSAESRPLGCQGTPQIVVFFFLNNNKENLDPTCSRYI